jgi:hypothetical protein
VEGPASIHAFSFILTTSSFNHSPVDHYTIMEMRKSSINNIKWYQWSFADSSSKYGYSGIATVWNLINTAP